MYTQPQETISQMQIMYRMEPRQKTEATVIKMGVIGEKLGHSLSPEIHAYLLEQQNLKGTYELFEVDEEEVKHIVERMKAEEILGMNVTIPYKETLMEYVDELSPEVLEIGALNTIYLKDGRTYGHNTDYIGVLHMFKRNQIDLAGKNCVILGSGGAAKAVIYALRHANAASVTVAARNVEKLVELKQSFSYIHTCLFDEIKEGDILINTTPVGMYPKIGKSIVGREVIRKFKVAADIVYNPLMTEFLLLAEQEGVQTVTGLSMLVDQAIGSEEIWFEKKLDYELGTSIHDELAEQF